MSVETSQSGTEREAAASGVTTEAAHDTAMDKESPFRPTWKVLCGDASEKLATLPVRRFNCVVTSPPYFWQRDYGVDGQIGLEASIDEYVSAIADTMDGVRRTMARDGVLFLNLGDTYYSKKGKPKGKDRKNWARRFGGVRLVDTSALPYRRKTMLGMPWRVALEMINRGWVLRSNIIWCREHVQPEPTARDRPWRSYENLFMFSKSSVYSFDRSGLEGPHEDVWIVHSQSRKTGKRLSAYFPEGLVERCIRVACPEQGWVLDPFAGTGTVLKVAIDMGRHGVGIDLNSEACAEARTALRERSEAIESE